MKYFIYARKSTESEDRQMASIEDQIAEMKKLSNERGFDVLDVITEARSAKEPGREEFNNMLLRIEKGEAQGILCWKLNRLARNPIDGGRISWLLQQQIIQHIQTHSREYFPHDNVLMMSVEFGMANQYVKELSVDVSRGMRRKAERGWYPSKPPLGYTSLRRDRRNLGQDEVIPHETYFPIVKRLWKLLLTENHSVADLKREGDKLGLLNINGNPFSKNAYHDLFRNEFYTGIFYWNNENGEKQRYVGKHTPMITAREFAKAQLFLKQKVRWQYQQKHYLPYRGLIDCGECSGRVTAEHKLQVICTTCKRKFSIKTIDYCPKCRTKVSNMDSPSMLDITYYHCTKNKGICTQRSIRKEYIDKVILDTLKEISITDEFYAWVRSIIVDMKTPRNDEIAKRLTALKKRETELLQRIDGYVRMRADGEISKEELKSLKDRTTNELHKTQSSILDHTSHDTKQKERIKSALDLCRTAYTIFETKDDETKHAITQKLASNLTQMDKTLYVSTDITIQKVKEAELVYYRLKGSFEPKKALTQKGSFSDFAMQSPVMWRALNALRTCQDNIKSIPEGSVKNLAESEKEGYHSLHDDFDSRAA